MRPDVITQWAKRSGDIASSPKINDLEEFGSHWRTWYRGFQPTCRLGRQNWPLLKKAPTDPFEWESLRKGSKRGLILILVSLLWWDEQAVTKRERAAFSSAFNDVVFVMRELSKPMPNDGIGSRKHVRGCKSRRTGMR